MYYELTVKNNKLILIWINRCYKNCCSLLVHDTYNPLTEELKLIATCEINIFLFELCMCILLGPYGGKSCKIRGLHFSEGLLIFDLCKM